MLNPSKADLDETLTWLDPSHPARSANEPLRRDEEDEQNTGSGVEDGGNDDNSTDDRIDDDVVAGDGGDNQIDTDLGDDHIDAGKGDDSVDARSGNDTVKAGSGDDTVVGGDGSDSIEAGAGDDSLDGGKGKDTLNGGEGDDQVEAGAGDDLIKGEGGDDLLEGDKGDDTLKGGKGDDTLNGGEGDDLLIGGKGGDVYVLSSGNDTIQGYTKGDKIVLSDELIDAGITIDDIRIKEETDGARLTFDKNGVSGNTLVTESKLEPSISTFAIGTSEPEDRPKWIIEQQKVEKEGDIYTFIFTTTTDKKYIEGDIVSRSGYAYANNYKLAFVGSTDLIKTDYDFRNTENWGKNWDESDEFWSQYKLNSIKFVNDYSDAKAQSKKDGSTYTIWGVNPNTKRYTEVESKGPWETFWLDDGKSGYEPFSPKQTWEVSLEAKSGTKKTGNISLQMHVLDRYPLSDAKHWRTFTGNELSTEGGCVDLYQDIKPPKYLIIEGDGTNAASKFAAIFESENNSEETIEIPVCGGGDFAGTEFNDSITGSASNERISSFGGKDTIDGGGGNDDIRLVHKDDDVKTIIFSEGQSTVEGFEHGDLIRLNDESQKTYDLDDPQDFIELTDKGFSIEKKVYSESYKSDETIIRYVGEDKTYEDSSLLLKKYEYYEPTVIYSGDGKSNKIDKSGFEGTDGWRKFYYNNNYGSKKIDGTTRLVPSDSYGFEANGLEGNDTIIGSEFNDIIFGGNNDDHLEAKGASEWIETIQYSWNYLYGEKGNDNLVGGDSNDILVGGWTTNKAIAQNQEQDTLNGGDGGDVLFGGWGDDVLVGGEGQDLFLPAPGNNTVKDFTYGEDDFNWADVDVIDDFRLYPNDNFVNKYTNLYLKGDSAKREEIFGDPSKHDTKEFVYDESSIRHDKKTGSFSIDVVLKKYQQKIAKGEVVGTTRFFLTNQEEVQGDLLEELKEEFVETEFTDSTLYHKSSDDYPGNSKRDLLFVLEKPDNNEFKDKEFPLNPKTISYFAGKNYDIDDKYYGEKNIKPEAAEIRAEDSELTFEIQGSEKGINLITGGNSNDSIKGGKRNDYLEGGNGNDTIDGGNGDDKIDGGAGNDFIKAGWGTNILDGGDGDDTYRLNKGTNVITSEFEQGADFITNANNFEDVVVVGYSDLNGESAPGLPEEYQQEWDQGNGAKITYKKDNETHTTYILKIKFRDDFQPEDIIEDSGNPGGGSGNGSGDNEGGGDSNKGGNGEGDDSNSENKFPGDPDDGDGSNSTIDGKPIEPEQNAGGDGDRDDGDGGDSTIDGKPIEPNGNGNESGDDSDANELRSIEVAKAPKNNVFDAAVIGSNDLPNRADRNDAFQGTNKNEKLHGRRGKDTLAAGGGDDYLFGGANHDILRGQDGDDVLEGQKGNDILDGGRGNDVLYGGFGEDTLTGGKGKDVFVLSPDNDVITDFEVRKDAIGIVYALDLTFTQKGDDLLIRGDDGVNTLLKGVEKDDFLANYPDNLQILPAVSVDVF